MLYKNVFSDCVRKWCFTPEIANNQEKNPRRGFFGPKMGEIIAVSNGLENLVFGRSIARIPRPCYRTSYIDIRKVWTKSLKKKVLPWDDWKLRNLTPRPLSTIFGSSIARTPFPYVHDPNTTPLLPNFMHCPSEASTMKSLPCALTAFKKSP